MDTIAVFGMYFGQLPSWIDNFVETCKYNPSVTWFLFVDGPAPLNRSANVRVVHLTNQELGHRLKERLGVVGRITNGYKLCDLRPVFGELFADYLGGFDFWGHCDLDVMWGSLRTFLTPQCLNDFDVISGDPGRLCGPFTTYRNEPLINSLYRRGAFEEVLARDTNQPENGRSTVNLSPRRKVSSSGVLQGHPHERQAN